MRHIALAILIFSAPLFAQVAFAQDGDPSIDAHRLGVMVDQIDAALHVISPKWQTSRRPPIEDGDAYSALVSAMGRFTQIEMRACRDQILGFRICETPPSAPRWMNARPADLRAAIDEASARIAPFWSDACARAKKATGNADFCAME